MNLEREGYQVVTAFDGKDGLEKVAAEKPALLVLDVMMPYMNGFEVLKALKRDPATADLPVIMLTAKAQDKDVFEGYSYGADMYLTKPFNPKELITFVRRILGGQDTSNSNRYEL
ncbi:MAG: response regulator [Fimbriimonadaceae bacterium]|nr:response regulator [Fimbriimonadaceae bacterium]